MNEKLIEGCLVKFKGLKLFTYRRKRELFSFFFHFYQVNRYVVIPIIQMSKNKEAYNLSGSKKKCIFIAIMQQIFKEIQKQIYEQYICLITNVAVFFKVIKFVQILHTVNFLFGLLNLVYNLFWIKLLMWHK